MIEKGINPASRYRQGMIIFFAFSLLLISWLYFEYRGQIAAQPPSEDCLISEFTQAMEPPTQLAVIGEAENRLIV